MMAEKEMRNQFRSAITAATVCCRMPVSDETSSITQYLKSLLDTALDGAGLYADVMPVSYTHLRWDGVHALLHCG